MAGIEDLLGSILGGAGGLLGGGQSAGAPAAPAGGMAAGPSAGGLPGGMSGAIPMDISKLLGPMMAIIQQSGGLEGMLKQIQSAGGGAAEAAGSWVSKGPNLPISSEQVTQALPNAVSDLAKQIGVPAQQAAGSIAEMLPNLVDKMTPSGQIPTSPSDLAGAVQGLPGADMLNDLFSQIFGRR